MEEGKGAAPLAAPLPFSIGVRELLRPSGTSRSPRPHDAGAAATPAQPRPGAATGWRRGPRRCGPRRCGVAACAAGCCGAVRGPGPSRGAGCGDVTWATLGFWERKQSFAQATILAALRPGAVERSFEGAVARQARRRMARNQLGHARQARPAAKAAKGGFRRSVNDHDCSGTAHHKGAISMQTHPAVRRGYICTG